MASISSIVFFTWRQTLAKSLFLHVIAQSPRHAAVHQVALADRAAVAAAILVQERHHWVGIAIVQGWRRAPAWGDAGQTSKHDTLLLLLWVVDLLLLRLWVVTAVGADGGLPVQAVEALIVVVSLCEHVVDTLLLLHDLLMLRGLDGSSQVGDVHAELDQQGEVICKKEAVPSTTLRSTFYHFYLQH